MQVQVKQLWECSTINTCFHSGPIPQPQLLTFAQDPLQRLLIKSNFCAELRANHSSLCYCSYEIKHHALEFTVNGQPLINKAKTAQ
ncbi:hypothetical protein KEM48_013153 [Puccinia striiformis f. sp. tritici PST-130]|nr:hypothetical protein KEM48_013153 [Puccinia striiformis f. sp. tritici PST-130]